MLAHRRSDVDDLNQAAHRIMLESARLGSEALTLADREFRMGDRVLCRQNDASLDVRNGTRGTVVAVDRSTLTVRDDAGTEHRLPLCYAAEHLEYGYAVTGHAAQGATVDRAFVLLVDEGALREWAYVACTRARAQTHLYLGGLAIELAPQLNRSPSSNLHRSATRPRVSSPGGVSSSSGSATEQRNGSLSPNAN
jgi:ATP-dependent exoDNAse (exonuclease V) alpha subunit